MGTAALGCPAEQRSTKTGAGTGVSPAQAERSSAVAWPRTLTDSVQETQWLDFLDSGRFKVQFRIKDQDYFLTFVPDEQRWFVFAPTATRIQRIPVYVDAVNWELRNLPSARSLSS